MQKLIVLIQIATKLPREYCATGPQHTQVCLMLVEFGIDLSKSLYWTE